MADEVLKLAMCTSRMNFLRSWRKCNDQGHIEIGAKNAFQTIFDMDETDLFSLKTMCEGLIKLRQEEKEYSNIMSASREHSTNKIYGIGKKRES